MCDSVKVCGSKKTTFDKEQEAKGLLSGLFGISSTFVHLY